MENNIDLQMADRLQELRDEKEQLEIALKEIPKAPKPAKSFFIKTTPKTKLN